MIRRLFRWIFRLALAALALALVLLLLKDSILRVVMEHRIRARTGMEVRIGKFSSGILSPVFTIEDLKLYNTAEFGGTPFLEVPELHAELDRSALAEHRIHFTLIRLRLAELDVVRSEAGRTNVFSIAKNVKKRDGESDSVRQLMRNYQFTGVDVLNLTMAKARYIDLQNPSNNIEKSLNIENQVFHNVNSEVDLYGIAFFLELRSGGDFPLALPIPPFPLERHKAADSGNRPLEQSR